MKPTIKYLHNGEYHYATVKDIGDIEQLKTAVTTDLVGAINSLLGHVGGDIPDDLQGIIDDMNAEIDSIASSGLNEQQLLDMQAEITKTHEAISAELQSKIGAVEENYNKRFDTITADYDQKVLDINNDIKDVKGNITDTEGNLIDVGAKLSGIELNVTDVQTDIDTINGELSSKVNSTDFELIESTVGAHETAISQNKKAIELKAEQETLDLATGRITDAEAAIEVNAQGIRNTVKRDELRKELDVLDIYAPNLLRDTRGWDGWEANTPSRAYVLSDTYQHTEIQEQLGSGAYLETILGELTVGETYTASVWAKTTGTDVKLDFRTDSVSNIMTNHNDDIYLSGDWQRVKITFVASGEEIVVSPTASGAVSGDVTHLAGAKVELGTENTGWQAHEDDVYEQVSRAQSTIDQQADQITSVVEEQKKIGEDVSSHTTSINQMSESIELHAGAIEEIEGNVSAHEASIKVNSNNILSKVEQSDIDNTIGGISLDSRNVILNSDFLRELEDWENVNDDFKVKDIDGKNHLTISRSGLSGDMVASASSNLFPAKNGDKLSIGLDVIIGSLSQYDNRTIVVLDLFDINDSRVDFKEFDLSEFDGDLTDGLSGRITTRYSIGRADVAKARLRLTLYRNGSVSYTNITIQKGDIKSVGWTPAPEDSQLVQANMKTLIDQNAESIALKADSDTVDKLTGDLESNSAELKVANNAIEANIDKLKKVDGTLEEHSASIKATAEELSSKMTSAQVDEMLGEKKYATQSELKQTSEGFTTTVSSIQDKLDNVHSDTVDHVTGKSPILSNLSQEDGAVHVEVDGGSVQEVVEGNPNLFSAASFVKNNDSGNGYFYEVGENGALIIKGVDGTGFSSYAKVADLEPNTTYTMTFSEPMNNRFELRNSNGGNALDKGWSRSDDGKRIVVTTGGDTTYMVGKFYPINQEYPRTVMVKVEKGSAATPVPTPSPDYPSEIHSLDKSFDVVSSKTNQNHIVNSDFSRGLDGWRDSGSIASVEYSIGEPFLRIDNSEGSSNPFIEKYIDVKGGKNYTFSWEQKRRGYVIIQGTDSDYNNLSIRKEREFYGDYTRQSISIYIPEDVPKIRIVFQALAGQHPLYLKAKLEEGTTATTWTPAPEDIPYNTLTDGVYKTNILLSEPLRSVGDVKDRLFRDKEDGLWRVERNVGEHIFDGTEAVFGASNSTTKTEWYGISWLSDKAVGATNLVFSHFVTHGSTQVTGDDTERAGGNGSSQYPSYVYFRLNIDKLNEHSSTGFKNWLSQQHSQGNPLTMQYELATPTTETLPQDMQQQLNTLPTYKDQTYVYTVHDKSHVLSPTLHGTFKSAGWARNRRTVTNLDTLEDTTLPALEDGLLNKSEKESIKQTFNVVKADKDGMDSQYTSVYGNSALSGSAKTNLYNAKVSYNNAYTALSNAILSVLNVKDGTRISQSQIDKVDTEFGDYGSALSVIRRRLEEALDAISGKKVGDVSDELGEVEKRVSSAEQKITDDKIVSTVSSSTTFKDVKNTADSAKSSINSLEIGGRNLSPNSNFSSGTSKWLAVSGGVKTDGDIKYITIVGTFGTYQTIETIKGQEYTISVLARKSSSSNSKFQVKFNTDNGDTNGVSVTSAEWERVSVSRVATTTGRQIMFYHTRNNYPIDIAYIMFEEGNKPSSWSPAPEDIDEKIGDVTSNLEGVEKRVSSAEQKITDSAITSTVTQSTTYKNAMGKLVEKDKISSTINQTVQGVTIDAKKINLQGAVTISSFENGLKSDYDSVKSTASTAKSTANTANSKARAIEGKINNAVTTIDNTGVTVKDGSFFLEDDNSDTKYSIVSKSNLLKDHSFELVQLEDKWDNVGNHYIKPNPDNIWVWETAGSPRMWSGLYDNVGAKVIFGMNALITDSSNYVRQTVPVKENGKYTASAFFKNSTLSSSVRPFIRIELLDGAFNQIQEWTKYFPAVNDSTGIKRYSLTADVTKITSPQYDWFLRVQFKSGYAGEWTMVDGTQLVEGSHPVHYDPETGLFDMMNGVKGSEVSNLDAQVANIENLRVVNDAQFFNGVRGTSYQSTNEAGLIHIEDTRDDGFPSDLGSRGVKFDLKRVNSYMNTGGTYATAMTVQNWGDSSGGEIHNLLFGRDGMEYRNTSIDGDLWNVWERVATVQGGSNSNGVWVRLSDGTLICRQIMKASSSISSSYYSTGWYRSDSTSWNFPMAFSGGRPVVFGMESRGVGYTIVGLGAGTITETRATFAVYKGSSTTNAPEVSLVAIGSWK